MGRYVEISKQSQAPDEHYYEVTPHDHPKIELFGLQLMTFLVCMMKAMGYIGCKSIIWYTD